MLALTLCGLSFFGCHQVVSPGTEGSRSPVRGSFSDVTTAAGTYDGYVVERKCMDRACVGIRGLGTQYFAGLEPQASARDTQSYFSAVAAFREAVLAAIGRPPSFRSSAHGHACTVFGLRLGTTDATQIDPVIPGIGRFLATSNLKEEVAVCHGGYLINAGEKGG
jgi:hypothetical protein